MPDPLRSSTERIGPSEPAATAVGATAPAPAALDQPAPTPEPAGPATVAAEAELLRRADAARKAGDASRALDLLDEHRARFPTGILVQEREAERVVVLCALGRNGDARAAATAFLRDWPHSPLAGRVRSSCGGS
jgi:RNA polymerase sigma-70 factor (ECF subfamily)